MKRKGHVYFVYLNEYHVTTTNLLQSNPCRMLSVCFSRLQLSYCSLIQVACSSCVSLIYQTRPTNSAVVSSSYGTICIRQRTWTYLTEYSGSDLWTLLLLLCAACSYWDDLLCSYVIYGYSKAVHNALTLLCCVPAINSYTVYPHLALPSSAN
jgi:hypothetical protein